MRLASRWFVALTLLAACAPPARPTDAEAPLDASMTDSMQRYDSSARDVQNSVVDVEVPDVAMTPLPDFVLEDQNPNSPTYGMPVTLQAQRGSISVWYFATSACHLCVQMVAALDRMQREITASMPTRPVKFFVIADLDSDGATSVFTMGVTLPVLQDNRTANVQANWMAAIRDVVLVDDEGTRRLVYNLTTRSLEESVYYNDLKSRILSFANR
jgi:hypothetical protein